VPIKLLRRAENVNVCVYVDSDEVYAVAGYVYDYVNVPDYLFVNIKMLMIEAVNICVYTYTYIYIYGYVNGNVYIDGDLIFYPGSMSKKRF
jgi:hypothetical protein